MKRGVFISNINNKDVEVLMQISGKLNFIWKMHCYRFIVYNGAREVVTLRACLRVWLRLFFLIFFI